MKFEFDRSLLINFIKLDNNLSTSSIELSFPKLIRKLLLARSCDLPIAVSTCEGCKDEVEHALPLYTQILSKSSPS